MDKAYSIEQQGDIAVIRLHRVLTLAEGLDMIEYVGTLDGCTGRVWNLGDYFKYTPAEVAMFAERARAVFPGPTRVAYVATGDVSFGLANVVAVYREETDTNYRLFRDEESAIAWLTEGNSPD